MYAFGRPSPTCVITTLRSRPCGPRRRRRQFTCGDAVGPVRELLQQPLAGRSDCETHSCWRRSVRTERADPMRPRGCERAETRRNLARGLVADLMTGQAASFFSASIHSAWLLIPVQDAVARRARCLGTRSWRAPPSATTSSWAGSTAPRLADVGATTAVRLMSLPGAAWTGVESTSP